jgi:Glycine rich protein
MERIGNYRIFNNTSTGRDGANLDKSSGNLGGNISMSNGMYKWTVPVSGKYQIEAVGAKGGSPGSYSHYGRGALLRGEFELIKGEIITILVGQEGQNSTVGGGGSGGGGTFVTIGSIPLVVAGGGSGGGNYSSPNYSIMDASISNDGPDYVAIGRQSAGGAGGSFNVGYYNNWDVSGRSFIGGGLGGYNTNAGGFGGGGGSTSNNYAAGGGGYSGGSEIHGTNTYQGGIGGGGSFNSGERQYNLTGQGIGHGKVTITLLEILNIFYEEWDFSYNGGIQSFVAPYSGIYRLQLWGAEGGSANGNSNHRTPSGQPISNVLGGKGGYSEGDIYLVSGETIYVVVGGKGNNYTSQTGSISGGYNGGGNSDGTTSAGGGGGGGGATHISRQNSLLKNCSKSNVLIVAGGGGGAWGCNSYTWSNYRGMSEGAYGGGLTGGRAGYNGTMGYTSSASNSNIYNQNDSRSQAYNYATGGSQTSGGIQGTSSGSNSYYSHSVSPSFGLGGSSRKVSSHSGGGGGGGYYGGAAGANGENANGTGGGGGSSYIGGVEEGITLTGEESIPDYTNTSSMTGNSGNGFAKISYQVDTIRIDNIKFTPENIHHENVNFSCDLVGYTDDIGVKYRITINDNICVDWNERIDIEANQTYTISKDIGNEYFNKIGINNILVEFIVEETENTIQIEGFVTKTNSPSEIELELLNPIIHKEPLRFNLVITDPDNGDNSRYRLFINDIEKYSWSWFSKTPFFSSLVIPNAELKLGTNKIRVDVEDNFGGFNTKEVNIKKRNYNPSIGIDYFMGNTLLFTIVDNDNDKVAFKVSINGVTQMDFSTYRKVPFQAKVIIDPKLISLGEVNTIKIEGKDELGGIGDITLQREFILPVGLIFCDVDEQVYSNEAGLILRTLEHNDLVAGNKSDWKEVWIKNTFGYKMNNIKIIIDQGVLDSVHELVEIAYPTTDYVSSNEIIIGNLEPNEKKSFFIRVNADREAITGGHFYVYCTGDPK